MSTVDRVKFLWDSSMAFNVSATHVNNLLKSNLRGICQKLAGTNTSIPLDRFSESQMCRCSLHWQANSFKIKYEPQGIQITTNKTRKLLKRFTETQKTKNARGQALTRKQKMRAKWLLKRAKNRMAIQCDFCQHKTFIDLEKPPKLKKAENVTPVEATLAKVEKPSKKAKKNKPKDKMAGLKISTHNPKTVQKQPAKLNLDTKKSPMAKMKSKKSKTSQQKNSLLHLANLLKSQDNSSMNKNRLESLLK